MMMSISDGFQVQTLGVDFKLKPIVINDEVVDLQVWDTAGQVIFLRGCHRIDVNVGLAKACRCSFASMNSYFMFYCI